MKTSYDVLGDLVAGRPACRIGRRQRGLVRVVGPDALGFLHRICSQDVEGLAVGECAPAALLDPKGKIVALVRVGRDADGALIEAAAEALGVVREYLDRFHFTESLSIEALERRSVTVLGTRAWAAADVAPGLSILPDGLVAFASSVGELQIVSLHGADDGVDARTAGIDELDACLAPAVGLLLRDFVVGAALDAVTIALEAPIDDHISTTKGCYTGQEIVARIHTYGHVNRRLVLWTSLGTMLPDRDCPLFETEEGDAVGRVTAAAALPDGMLGVGYVPREFAEPCTALRLGSVDGVEARVVPYADGAEHA